MHSASSALGAFKHVSVGLIYDTFVYELNLTQVELRLQSICMIEIETYCNTVTSAFLKRRRVWGNATITPSLRFRTGASGRRWQVEAHGNVGTRYGHKSAGEPAFDTPAR
jgi:hypothetical protein